MSGNGRWDEVWATIGVWGAYRWLGGELALLFGLTGLEYRWSTLWGVLLPERMTYGEDVLHT
jgi:hypothetical protein